MVLFPDLARTKYCRYPYSMYQLPQIVQIDMIICRHSAVYNKFHKQSHLCNYPFAIISSRRGLFKLYYSKSGLVVGNYMYIL